MGKIELRATVQHIKRTPGGDYHVSLDAEIGEPTRCTKHGVKLLHLDVDDARPLAATLGRYRAVRVTVELVDLTEEGESS